MEGGGFTTVIHLIAPPDSNLVHLALPADAQCNRWTFIATAESRHRIVLEPAAALSAAGIRSADWGAVVAAGIEQWRSNR